MSHKEEVEVVDPVMADEEVPNMDSEGFTAWVTRQICELRARVTALEPKKKKTE